MGRMCLELFYATMMLLLHMNPVGSSSEVSHRATNIRCIEKERQALLAFKQGLVDNRLLSSWGSNMTTDCCKWKGVYCSKQTGHVTKLALGALLLGDFGLSLQGKISPKLFELQHLEYLDLNFNNFSHNQIPKSIGSLSSLRFLSLSDSNFGGEVPYQLGNLTQLEFLDLGFNYFTNPKNLNWLPHLSSLTYLNLDMIDLSNVFDWPKVVDKLPKLHSLRLSSCDLPTPIFSSLSHINTSESLSAVDLSGNHLTFSIFHWLLNYNASLVSIDLSVNHLSASIPDVFGNLSSLLHLSLAYNSIEGQIPKTFGQLCSLQSLDLSGNNHSGEFSEFVQVLFGCARNSLKEVYLSDNQLTGRIPERIGSLSNLKALYVSMNSLTGEITEAHFSKLSKLRNLDLSSNSLTLNIRSDWLPPFQLGSIKLRSCKIGPSFPKWLRNQKSYYDLDLSDAGISDIFPKWFQDNYIKLSNDQLFDYRSLNLSSNQLEGPIHLLPSKVASVDVEVLKVME